jgi:tetratricopeptide (TPR) repeat protein
MLAISHAAQGNLEKAGSLLSDEADQVPTVEDARLHALLLVRQGGISNIQRATKLLEDLVNKATQPQTVDRQLLARLYEQQARTNDDPKIVESMVRAAAKQLTALVQGTDAEPTNVAGLIRFFNRQHNADESARWLERLEAQIEAQPAPDASLLALLIQVQIETNVSQRTGPWLEKLEAIETSPVRVLGLRAQAALKTAKDADISSLIEPKALLLVESAKTDQEKLRLLRSIGELYSSLEAHSTAEVWYRKLVDADPKQYSVIVTALARQGRVKEAIDFCEKAAETNNTSEPALMLAAALVEGAGSSDDFARAEPILKAAADKFSTDLQLIYSVALVNVVRGNASSSVDMFRKILEANPRYVPALNNLAMVLGDVPAERPEALRLIDQAIEIAGKDPSLLDTKGAILLYGGNSKQAIPLLESSIRLPGADPRHYFHLALAYQDLGRTAEAKVQLETALERKLASQVLTATDQKLLTEIRADLQL